MRDLRFILARPRIITTRFHHTHDATAHAFDSAMLFWRRRRHEPADIFRYHLAMPTQPTRYRHERPASHVIEVGLRLGRQKAAMLDAHAISLHTRGHAREYAGRAYRPAAAIIAGTI